MATLIASVRQSIHAAIGTAVDANPCDLEAADVVPIGRRWFGRLERIARCVRLFQKAELLGEQPEDLKVVVDVAREGL